MADELTFDVAAWRALNEGHHAIPVEVTIFRLEGKGTIPCLQGMLTNDVAKTPTDGLVWGAFLTPKGMIITDAWVRRDGDDAWVLVPSSAGETVRALFAKTVPPRLAKVREVTGEFAVRWLVGGGTALPESVTVIAPTGKAPFRGLVMSAESGDATDALLQAAGWHAAPAAWSEAARLLAGWPALGREIDEKTLPQEVGFDELGGVRYDKGCYTGQETVARLHFRGHANRLLRGLRGAGAPPIERTVSSPEGKEVGGVTTLVVTHEGWLGLGKLRREIEPGGVVRVGGEEATVIALPDWSDGPAAG